jgi:hypothetical protein
LNSNSNEYSESNCDSDELDCSITPEDFDDNELSEELGSDVALEFHDASNIGLIDFQNLIHNSKVELVFSGGGFVIKNSENENFEYFENFTRISLMDNSSIPKYHSHDQIPFSFTFLNFIVHMVLFLVVDSSHELHFSHHFLLQWCKHSCSS